ncbi:hypothetical protein DIT68_07515 [Brumimicrobium oceani]|uniref:Outer membrane protein beta-barrel domain-containing protein n=2 Tax=Brumimicrobium oceani TaxID=2100725 RepID=A0A2U2XDW1_9FLAO|nr:hypothetical protein DIT68_07515 [Brumimicrobium oceani]
MSDTLGLQSLFFNVIPAVIYESNGSKLFSKGGSHNNGMSGVEVVGIQLEMGSHRAFSKNQRRTGFFRFTWARVGIHNYGLLLAPAQVGLGSHVIYSSKKSLELSLNAGLIITTDDVLYPEIEFDYAVYPQLRFNFENFSLGIEYTFKREFKEGFNLLNGYHYVGIVIGSAHGKRIN